MSDTNSIVARMGLDLNGLQRDFSSAEKLAVRAANNMQAELKKAQGSGGHGEGGAHGGSMTGGATNNRALGDVLDGITGERGWVMKMNILQHSLPLAAVAGLAIGLVKAREAFEDLVKTSDDARAVLSKPMEVVIHESGGNVAKHLEELKKAQEELHAKSTGAAGVGASMWEAVRGGAAKAGNALTGSNDFDGQNKIIQAHELEKRLAQERLDGAIRFKEVTAEEIEERRQAVEMGGKELQIVTERQKMEKDIADIQANGQGTETNSTLISERQAAFELAKEEIERKAAATEREMDLQRAILSVKMIGKDVAIEEAKARVDAADKEFEFSRGDEERGAAALKQQAARLALRDAQRTTDEQRAQLAIASAIANYRGPAEEKQLEKLIEESAELERQLKTLGQQEDKRKDIQAKLDQNHAETRAINRTRDARAHERADTLIDATTGDGQRNQARAVARKLAEAKRYQDKIADNPEVSQDEKDGAAAKVNQLIKQQAELGRAKEKSIRDAKAEVAVTEEQLGRHAEVAEALRTQHEFEEKITEARRNGSTELVKTLQLQKQLALQGQIQSLERSVGDRSKATLSELAAHAHNQDGAHARQAQHLEQRANLERMHGHTAHAAQLQAQADKIKGGIGSLKSSEKDGGLAEEQLKELKGLRSDIVTAMTAQ